MAPEGGHIGFDLTIFIVFRLSWNFDSVYNSAKEVDWAVCLSVRPSVRKSFFNTSPSVCRSTSQINHINGFVSSRRTKMLESRFSNIHFRSALKSKNSKEKTCFSGWTMLKSFCQYFFNFSSSYIQIKNTNKFVSSRRREWLKPFFEFHFFLVLKCNLKKHAFFNFGSYIENKHTTEFAPSRRTRFS